MVGQAALNRSIGVRLPVSQPRRHRRRRVLATETIAPVRSIHAPDRAGVAFIAPRVLSPDASTHCYQYVQQVSTLYSATSVQ